MNKHELKMKVLLGLGDSSIVKMDDRKAIKKINSEWELKIDVTFPPELWEAFSKGKTYDWKKGPGVPADVRGVIEALEDLYNTALKKMLDEGVEYTDEPVKEAIQPPKTQPLGEGPIRNDSIKETAENVEIKTTVHDKAKELEGELLKNEKEAAARAQREENERMLAEAEQFKQERDEAEAASRRSEPTGQNKFKKPVENDLIYSQPEDVFETAPIPKKGVVKLLDVIYDLVEDDLVQFFGKTGTCKTSIAIQAALEARSSGKSVYYLDTEKNISRKKKTAMKDAGVIYMPYTPSNSTGEFRTVNDLIALHDFIKKIQKVDVLIIDSLGLPVLSVFCEGNQKDQGLSIQKMINISKYLKSFANKNQSLVIVINQPESDMNKDPKTERRSFGEKAEFFYKELLKTFFVEKTDTKTTVVVKTYRSRDYGQGYKLFTVEITEKGMKVIQ